MIRETKLKQKIEGPQCVEGYGEEGGITRSSVDIAEIFLIKDGIFVFICFISVSGKGLDEFFFDTARQRRVSEMDVCQGICLVKENIYMKSEYFILAKPLCEARVKFVQAYSPGKNNAITGIYHHVRYLRSA